MLIHFNDLFAANLDGTVSPLADVKINGKVITEGQSLEVHEEIAGFPLSELRGKFLEGDRKPDGGIDIKSYVRSL